MNLRCEFFTFTAAMADDKKREFDAKPTDIVETGDTIVARQRLL